MLCNHCPECAVGWMPYMTVRGACPQCGTGTVKRQADADTNVGERFELVRAARARRENHDAFHAFCEERDKAAQPTEPIDVAAIRAALAAA